MSAYWWVGLGGLLGSMARYAIALWLAGPAHPRFPWATFAVNVAGCLLIGLVAGWCARNSPPESLRLFLVTGLLGGFTTFSAFGLETLHLLKRGDLAIASIYTLASVVVSLAAVWLGLRIAAAP